jgi:thiamine-monophosphate kinase
MSEPTELTIAELGEQQLLQNLYSYCDTQVVGDDAALLALEPPHELAVTTDMLVDGIHFSIGLATPGIYTTSPFDVGWRSAAANLSDLAAMGAKPLGITVSLGLPAELLYSQVEAFYQGLQNCLTRYGTAIVGGDVCCAAVWSVSITALGQVHPQQKILRNQAHAGDVIFVTGVHGASRAGLELLLNPALGQALSNIDRDYLIQAHQRPIPRLDVPPKIWQLAPQSRVAGMDSSDGLADAVLQICRASGVGAVLDYDRLPMPQCFNQLQCLSEEDRVNFTLYGGEDFELVLFLEEKLAVELQTQLPGQATIIGHVQADKQVTLIDRKNTSRNAILTLEKGFQHFSV